MLGLLIIAVWQNEPVMETSGVFVYPGVVERDQVSESGSREPGVAFTVRRSGATTRVEVGKDLILIQDKTSATIIDLRKKLGLAIVDAAREQKEAKWYLTRIFPLWPTNYGPSADQAKYQAFDNLMKVLKQANFTSEKRPIGEGRNLLSISYQDAESDFKATESWGIFDPAEKDSFSNLMWSYISNSASSEKRAMMYSRGFEKAEVLPKTLTGLPKGINLATVKEKDFRDYPEGALSKSRVGSFNNLDELLVWLRSLYARTRKGEGT